MPRRSGSRRRPDTDTEVLADGLTSSSYSDISSTYSVLDFLRRDDGHMAGEDGDDGLWRERALSAPAAHTDNSGERGADVTWCSSSGTFTELAESQYVGSSVRGLRNSGI
ncbi:hypothetical protein Bbelb_207680 [Branchiostoma belcheri]|nr:hypothetical protein Bbelb_207680 [Branchiostoma belcheri]